MRRSPSRNLRFRCRSRAKSSKEAEYSEVWFAEFDCPAVEPGFPLRMWIWVHVVVRLCLSWENVVIILMEADCFRYGAVARTWPSEVIPVRLGNKFPLSGWRPPRYLLKKYPPPVILSGDGLPSESKDLYKDNLKICRHPERRRWSNAKPSKSNGYNPGGVK